MDGAEFLRVATWALLTGGITGAVWVGIVLVSRHRRVAERQHAVLEDAADQLEAADDLSARLMEVEERMDFAERKLLEQRRGAPPASPRDGGRPGA